MCIFLTHQQFQTGHRCTVACPSLCLLFLLFPFLNPHPLPLYSLSTISQETMKHLEWSLSLSSHDQCVVMLQLRSLLGNIKPRVETNCQGTSKDFLKKDDELCLIQALCSRSLMAGKEETLVSYSLHGLPHGTIYSQRYRLRERDRCEWQVNYLFVHGIVHLAKNDWVPTTCQALFRKPGCIHKWSRHL